MSLRPRAQVSLGTCCELCVSWGPPSPLHASPYVAIQCTVTAQSSGDDRSVCVPPGKGALICSGGHTLLSRAIRGDTHTNMDTCRCRLQCAYAIWTNPGEQSEVHKAYVHTDTDTHCLWLHGCDVYININNVKLY